MIRTWQIDSPQSFKDIRVTPTLVLRILPLKNGKLLYAGGDGTLGLLGPGGEVQYEVAPRRADFFMMGDNLRASEDGSAIEFLYGMNEPGVRFSVRERQLNGPTAMVADVHAPNPKTEGVTGECSDQSPQYQIHGNPLSMEFGEAGLVFELNDERDRIVLGTNFYVRLYDLSGEPQWEHDVRDVVWSVNLTRDGQLVIAATQDGMIHWYRASDGKELLTLFLHRDRKSWVLWTPDGYFDAGGIGESLIQWHLNRGGDIEPQSFAVDQFRDRFYRPDIVSSALDPKATSPR